MGIPNLNLKKFTFWILLDKGIENKSYFESRDLS